MPKKAYIVCCGLNGRCVIYGRCQEPCTGAPCRMEEARMVLYWPSGGLLGLASAGPPSGTQITHSVSVTETSPVTEWIEVSVEAAKAIDSWPPA